MSGMMQLESNRAGSLKQMQSDYACFVPRNLRDIKVELGHDMLALLNQAYLLLGRLDGMAITLPDTDLFVSMYVQKEAVISSQIEGTQASLMDVLQKNKSGEKRQETEEVVNYIKATNYAFHRLQELPLCMRLIRETHKVLLSGVRGNEKLPGEFRKTQNWIGLKGCTINTASFVPPAPEEMEKSLSDLEKYFHDSVDIPSLIKAGLIHYQFETIHPFLDGNGRIGRLLIILFLKEIGLIHHPVLYLSYYFKAHRNQYYELLNNVRIKGEYEEWLKFFIKGICVVSQDAIDSIQRIVEMKGRDTKKIREESRINVANMLSAYEYLLKHPYVDAVELTNAMSLSRPTVYALLEELTRLAIVELVEEKKRYREYYYKEYVDILGEGTLL